ncbi:hypothetical protein [Paraburkholderia sp. EG304]|uniref:hypothetical protein n=1 Tax=Paraburkholderia sp. EG304 TaxID=3237015 RepID=UPI00397BA1FF
MRRLPGEQQQALFAAHLLQLCDQHGTRACLHAGVQRCSRRLQLRTQAGIAAPHFVHTGVEGGDAFREITRSRSHLAQRIGAAGIMGIALQLGQGRLQALLRRLQRLAVGVIEGGGIAGLQPPCIGDLGGQRRGQRGLLLVRRERLGRTLGIMARPAVHHRDREQAQAADQQAGREFPCDAETAERGKPAQGGQADSIAVTQAGDEQRQAAGDGRHHVLQAEGRIGIGRRAVNFSADLDAPPGLPGGSPL